jgi:small subunit ribosomal protein S18
VAAGKKRGRIGEEPARSSGKARRTDPRRRSCFFCKQKVAEIDYKDIAQLRRFVSDRGKIRGRGQTGACRRHQSQLAAAIKRAREMALLPYVGNPPDPTTRSRPRADTRSDG